MSDSLFARLTQVKIDRLSRRGLGGIVAGALIALGLSAETGAKKKRRKKRKQKQSAPATPNTPNPDICPGGCGEDEECRGGSCCLSTGTDLPPGPNPGHTCCTVGRQRCCSGECHTFAGRTCGFDGCDGFCQPGCSSGFACNDAGTCVCPFGSVICQSGECINARDRCDDGTTCDNPYHICRGQCGCQLAACTQDSDCFHETGAIACRNGCCCFTGPPAAGGTVPGCPLRACCSLRSGPQDPVTGLSYCALEDE